MREARERDRKLTLRHRWYAGGIATVLSGALIFTGVAPAIAEETPAPVEPTTSETTDASTADETTPEESTTEESTPEESTTPEKSEPAPEKSESQTDEGSDAEASEPDEEPVAQVKSLALGGDFQTMAVVDPSTVPNNSANTNKNINISKAGGRPNTSSAPSGLAGAVFVAVNSSGNTPPALPTSLDTATNWWCTTNASGDCTIKVPNGNATWWVLEYSAPAGYSRLDTVALANVGTGSGVTPTSPFAYAFRVQFTGSSSESRDVPGTNTGNGSTVAQTPQVGTQNWRTRSGEWANIATNGTFPAACGVRIAMVFDVSASVDSTELNSMKNSAKAFVSRTTGLGGTPSEVSVFRFASTASQVTSGSIPSRVSIATDGGIGNVNTMIDAVSASGAGSYTNWDHALRTVTDSGDGPWDVVLFITDGDPTAFRNTANTSTTENGYSSFATIENAVFSANLLKSKVGPKGNKTFILPLGVAIDNDSINNLVAISGAGAPRTVATFPALTAELQAIAAQNCGGTLSVAKVVLDANNNPLPVNPNSVGWDITMSGPSNPSSTKTTDTTGAVNFPINFGSPVANKTLAVSELQKPSHQFVSATCTNATIQGTPSNGALNVVVEPGKSASCTITNKQLPPTQLKLVKAFQGTAYGPHVPADWTLTATPTAGGSTTNFAHNETKSVTAGTQYTISEIAKAGYDKVSVSCTGGTFVSPDKVTVAANTTATCTVTNKSNPAKLRIVKQDTAGQPLSGATFQLWRETGAANGLQTSNPNQDTLVNGSISAGTFDANDLTWGTYYVKEIAAPSGYTIASPDTQTVVLGAGDTGTAKTVTFQNAEIKPKLTLKKNVVNNGIGTRQANEWTLTAAGAPGWNGTATGAGATASTAKQEVPANTDITLGETGPAGYTASAWTCDSGVTVTNGKIKLPRAADVTCTITNTVKTYTVSLKKEWTNGLNGASAALSISSGDRSSTPVTSNVGDDINAKVATLEVAVGATVNLSEVVSGPGTYSTTLDCNPQQSLTAADDRHQSFVAPAQNVTCTFRNASNSVTVELIKVWAGQPFAGDQATLNIKRGDEVLTTGTSTAPTSTTISTSARIGDELVLSEALGSQNQGAYDTSWTCTNGVQAPANGAVATAKITVTGEFSCTVTNTPKTVKVKVNKHWVNGFTGDVANITVNGTPGTSTIDAQDGNETDLTVIEKVVRIGETVNISETLPASNTGSYDSQYRCGTAAFTTGTTIPAIVKIQADTTCEFKNTPKTLKVYLQKQWIDGVQGDQATLSMTGASNKTSTANGQNGSWVDAGNVLEATVRVGDQVSFSETLNSVSGAQYTTANSCWGADGFSRTGTGTSFSIAKLPADSFVTCVFTNQSVQGEITLLKEVDNGDGGTAADTDWTLNGAGPVAISGVEGHANVTNVSVPAGTYVLTETNGPAGYQQTDLECTGGTLTAASGQTPASVVVPAGGNVVCTFYNDDIAPKLTLKKNVVNTGGGIQTADAWTLTAQKGDDAPVINEQGTPSNGGASATTATRTVTANVAYQLSESVIAGYTPGDWSCVGQGGSLQAGAVTLQLGANVVCEITNTAIPATGEHTKAVKSISQGATGVWEIVYEIVVKNTSAASTLTYDLADDLRFGSGIVVQDASWSGPAPATTPTGFTDTTDWRTQIASGATLPQNAEGNAQHVYTVTAHATIANFPGEQDTWQNCPDLRRPADGGFLNESALTIDGKRHKEHACDAPEFPSVTKTAGAPVQNATTGAWTVTYQIVVKTTGGAGDPAVQTVATEILPEIQTDWTLVGGTWSVTSGENTPALDTTGTPGVEFDFFSGSIPAGSTYVYNVTGVVTPDSESTEHLGLCGQNGGLLNYVKVTSGAAFDETGACVEIPVATVSVDKEAKSVAQNEDGSWLVTYLVSVTNDSSEVAAVYDLTDAPLFGTDASADDVQWAPANAAGVATGPFAGSTQLADDKVLAGGATDYYLVQVTATIDPEAWVEGEDGVLTLPCPAGWETPNGSNGGLRNSATATAGGESDTDFGCIEPRQPKVAKDPVSVVQDAVDPNQWRVSYRITVTPSGTEVYYELGDQPHFAAGVNVQSGSAQRVDTDPVGPVISNIASDGSAFTGPVKLEADAAPHEYLVTWLVRIPAQIPAELRECGEGQTEGVGFFNTAILTVSEVEQTDDACADIEEKVYPDMTKTVTDLSRDPDTKEWTITYGIDVTLPGSDDLDPEGQSLNPKNLAGGYILDEKLEYGVIDIVGAEWTGHTEGQFANGTDTAHLAPLGDADLERIDAGATHAYTVIVRATLDPTDLRERTIGCTVQNEVRGIGFFNQATLSYGEELPPVVRDACTVPVYPGVDKSAVSVTENEDGTQRVSYLVTVTSPAPVEGEPVTNVIYTLTDAPDALPAGTALGGDELWHAESADDDTPAPDAATWNGSGTWNLQAIAAFSKADREAGKLVHTYRVWADLEVTSVPAELPEACGEGESAGIPIWNTVTLTSGEHEDSAVACEEVHFDDVELVKTSVLPDGQDSVEPGDRFDYVLTVTNNGTRDATGVQVTDDSINDRLEIVSVSASTGYTFTGAGFTGNDVDLALNEPLAPGASAVVTVRVEFLPASGGEVPAEGDAPALSDPLEQLENTACVAADADDNPDNNCDDETVFTRDLTASVFTRCVNDAPLLGWTVKKSERLRDLPISFVWTPDQGGAGTVPPNVELSAPAGELEWSDLIPWPGTDFSPSGVSIDYPGWRPLVASDYGPNGGYIYPADGLEYAPEDAGFFIFNGLILDDSELDYAWRNGTTIEFSVNPELTFSASYPEATPECFVARHTEVQIEKTASVEKSEPGKSFTYTLEVENVSDDAAADSVVVTDKIPADIKITDVTWPGKGDADAFPNWESCAVSGQNGSGYGGTLTCELYGPLQPVGSDNGGATAAPTITLKATVSSSSKASVITNVAVVDYHTFGDPDDAGRDSDDATVLLSALPATGTHPLLPLVMLGFLVLLAGATAVVISRRRRGESKLTL